ncbi:MAG: sensor histidine kinase [Dehalococcoidales bacterium]|nr:sensor histidine kinase [Dehalococcoidales bacterium]
MAGSSLTTVAQHYAVLASVVRLGLECRDAEDMAVQALSELQTVVPFSSAAVFLFDPAESTLRLLACVGDEYAISHVLPPAPGLPPLAEAEQPFCLPSCWQRRPVARDENGEWLAWTIKKGSGAARGLLVVGLQQGVGLGPEQASLVGVTGDILAGNLEHLDMLHMVEREAREQERARAGKALHDGVAQSLWYLSLELQRAQTMAAAGEAQSAVKVLSSAISIADTVYGEVRALIGDLRSGHEATGVMNVPRVMRNQVDRFVAQTGIDVRWTSGGVEWLADASVSGNVVSILREALTNVAKHAAATCVWVTLREGRRNLVVRIRDNGRGARRVVFTGTDGLHLGLRLMRERARAVGGRLEVSSTPGKGTTVTLLIPRS